jgi:hypothetical protein
VRVARIVSIPCTDEWIGGQEGLINALAIDRRVARIKARVAELTGNMEAPSAAAARRPVS